MSMTPEERTVQEVLAALSTSPRQMTEWERNFLASVRAQTLSLRPGQQQTLVKLAEEYLEDALLVAELRGQLRLFV